MKRKLSVLLKLLYWLPKRLSGKVWDESYSHLNEYNKTVITLSSSTLILSITAIQISKIHIDKYFLATAWILFILVLISGVLLFFINYLHSLTDNVIKSEFERKKYKDRLEFVSSDEASFYFTSRQIMFFLALMQLLFFVMGLIALMVATFKLIS